MRRWRRGAGLYIRPLLPLPKLPCRLQRHATMPPRQFLPSRSLISQWFQTRCPCHPLQNPRRSPRVSTHLRSSLKLPRAGATAQHWTLRRSPRASTHLRSSLKLPLTRVTTQRQTSREDVLVVAIRQALGRAPGILPLAYTQKRKKALSHTSKVI